jgi:hypothetical protein
MRRDGESQGGQEGEIDDHGGRRQPAPEADRRPAREPDQDQPGERRARDGRQPAPGGGRGQQKTGQHRRSEAEQHLVTVPEQRRQRRLEAEPAGVEAEPERYGERAVDAGQQEEGPKAVGKQDPRPCPVPGASNAEHDAHSADLPITAGRPDAGDLLDHGQASARLRRSGAARDGPRSLLLPGTTLTPVNYVDVAPW